MNTFLETMRVTDGHIENLDMHLLRMQNTAKEVFEKSLDFSELKNLNIPLDAKKCRLVYGKSILSIAFSDYTPRSVKSLKLINIKIDFDYHLKYEDRTHLNNLASQKGYCDEVLFVKDGFLTDTSYSNVVFTDGKLYVTPETYLLNGTMRRYLLQTKKIISLSMTPNDISKFTHVTLINAMLPLGTMPFIPTTNIF